jgi:hypothetical protein
MQRLSPEGRMRRRVGTVKRHLKLHSHNRSLTHATDIPHRVLARTTLPGELIRTSDDRSDAAGD